MSRRSGPLRVAFVTSLILGGSERQMMELARRLPKDRFEVTFLVVGERGPHAAILESWGVRVMSLGASRQGTTPFPIFAARVSGKVLRYVWWCRRERFDVIDAWLFHGYGLAAVTKAFTGVPVLISGRRSLSDFKADFGPLERIVDGIARRASDVIVANSTYVLADVVRHERMGPEKLRIIRNGVQVPGPMSLERRAELRDGWGFKPQHVVVGCVANYRPGKGLEQIINAAAALQMAAPDARYVLVGGEQRPVLQRLVTSLGLESIIALHGPALDARGLYAAFDVVAQASIAEGLPNALLEGAAAGRAIVATAAGGTPEIIIDGQTGLLVPVHAEAEFRTALLRLLNDANLRSVLGANAQDHVARYFGMERFVDETAALYTELAECKGLR